MQALARVALRRIEHFYYKTDAVYGAMRKLALQQKEAANAVQVRRGALAPGACLPKPSSTVHMIMYPLHLSPMTRVVCRCF